MKLTSDCLKKIVSESALSWAGERYSSEDMENEIILSFSDLKKWKRTHKSKLENAPEELIVFKNSSQTFSIWDGIDIRPWPHLYIMCRDVIINVISESYDKLAPDQRHLLGSVSISDLTNEDLVAYAYQLGITTYGSIHRVVDVLPEKLDFDKCLIESHILDVCWEKAVVQNAFEISRKSIVRHFENDLTGPDFDAWVITDEKDEEVLAILWHAD